MGREGSYGEGVCCQQQVVKETAGVFCVVWKKVEAGNVGAEWKGRRRGDGDLLVPSGVLAWREGTVTAAKWSPSRVLLSHDRPPLGSGAASR